MNKRVSLYLAITAFLMGGGLLPSAQTKGPDSQLHSPLREKLTRATWQFIRGEGPFAEGYKYDFFADGSLIRRTISDYAEERRGNWAVKTLANNRGLLFLVWQDQTESVLYFSMTENTMRLAGELLQAVKRSDGTSAGPGKPVLVDQKNFPNYFFITARRWHKNGGGDRDFIPDQYTFNRDGTFVAGYRNGQCQHSGHWSMTHENIVLEVPSHRCDLRGPRDSFNWTQTFKVENDRLALDHYIYTPSDR